MRFGELKNTNMASHADMDDDDIYPENDSYEPQESRMQDIDDEEEGEEVESDSDVRVFPATSVAY